MQFGGERTLWWYILGKKMQIFGTFYIILGVDFFSFHPMFWETLKMDFEHNSSYTILVIFQMIVFFQKTYMYSHTYICLNEKIHLDVFCEITWVELFI